MKRLFFPVVAGIFFLTALGSRPTSIPSLVILTPVPTETPSVDQVRSEIATLQAELREEKTRLLEIDGEIRQRMLQYQVDRLTDILNWLILALGAGALIITITWYFGERLTAIANRILRLLGIRLRESPVAYKERIAGLVRGLEKTSAELDSIYGEITEVLGQREATITRLQQRIETLAEQEAQLQRKVETLERVPLPAVAYFSHIVQRGERRSAWRDYLLFALGAIVSAVISFVSSALGK